MTLPTCLFTNKKYLLSSFQQTVPFSLSVCNQSSVSEMVPVLEGLGFHPNTDKLYIQFRLCYWLQCSKAKSYKQSFLRFCKLWELTDRGQDSFGALKCHQLATQCMSLVWAGFSTERCCCRLWTAFPRHLATCGKWLCEASTCQGIQVLQPHLSLLCCQLDEPELDM